MVKAVIFDFDGVILESVGVKKDAFRRLFQHYPDKVEEIVEYHMEQGGLSRYRKFQHIFDNILQEPLTQQKSEALGKHFTSLSHDAVIQSPFVEGARDFLENNYRKLKLFVASGTPHYEMNHVIDDMDLWKYFVGVFGSPASKAEIARKILTEHQLIPNEVVFVGDAVIDYQGAKAVGIPFIGRLHECYANPFMDVNVKYTLKDLRFLNQIIDKINS